MATTRRRIPHPPSAVLALLADGSRYAEWVVGTKRIRAVDPTWPAPTSQLHHTVGFGPLAIDDTTEVLAHEPGGSSIVLKARGWPSGAARVTICVAPAPDGESDVTIDEEPIEGPAKVLHNPVLDALLHVRSIEMLRRMDRSLDGAPS